MSDPIQADSPQKTNVAYSIDVSRADVIRAIKEMALKRLLEKRPSFQMDPVDWLEVAEAFLPAAIAKVPVTFGE